MNENGWLWRFLYPLLPSLAGAFAGLVTQNQKAMTWRQSATFLIAGTGFGFFVFPLLFQNITDPQIAGGVCFLMASAWNVLLPLFIKKFFTLPGEER